MSFLSFRADCRAVPGLRAFALVPVLAGTLTLIACPSLALRQDAKPAGSDTAPAKKDDTAYTIQRKYKAGDVDHYHINVIISGGIDATLDLLLKETTKDGKPADTIIIFDEFEKANATFNGTDQELTSAVPTFTTTRDKSGKVLESKMEGGNPLVTQSPLARMFKNALDIAVYPPKPIKVGDTWKYETASKEADQKVKGTATFVGLETINGAQTLKIKTVSDSTASVPNPMTGEIINIKQHSEGVQNLDLATGKLIKVKSNTSSEDNPGKGELTMTLVPDDKNKKADEKKADAKKADAPAKSGE